MLRDEENGNNSYPTRSYIYIYIYNFEGELCPIYQPDHPFSQDNSHINIANITQEWHEKRGIGVIDWPPCSPSINIFEHVYRALKYELCWLYCNLYELKNNTANVEIFKSRIKEPWERIDQEHIRKLIASIPARLNSCRNAKG